MSLSTTEYLPIKHNLGPAYSEIKAAVPIPKGMAITIAPNETNEVLATKGNRPYTGSAEVGFHSLPVMKSNGETLKKNDKALYKSIKKMPPSNAKTSNPEI